MLNLSELIEHRAVLEPESSDGVVRADGPRPCAVWEFFAGVDLALVAETVKNRYEESDFLGTPVPSADGTLTLEVIEGVARYDHRILYFVEDRGVFELMRRDVRSHRRAIRVRLVLRAL